MPSHPQATLHSDFLQNSTRVWMEPSLLRLKFTSHNRPISFLPFHPIFSFPLSSIVALPSAPFQRPPRLIIRCGEPVCASPGPTKINTDCHRRRRPPSFACHTHFRQNSLALAIATVHVSRPCRHGLYEVQFGGHGTRYAVCLAVSLDTE